MRRSLNRVYVHLVWATWDRLPLITAEIEHPLYVAIRDKCRELGCLVYAIGGIEDHVHLLVRMHPNIAVGTFVGDIKGASSHLVSHKLKPDEFFKWQGAYGSFSVELASMPRIIAYIKNLKTHHASRTEDATLESFLEADDNTEIP
jgi:putative transposase